MFTPQIAVPIAIEIVIAKTLPEMMLNTKIINRTNSTVFAKLNRTFSLRLTVIDSEFKAALDFPNITCMKLCCDFLLIFITSPHIKKFTL